MLRRKNAVVKTGGERCSNCVNFVDKVIRKFIRREE